MLKVLYPVTEVPAQGAGRKENGRKFDLVAKLLWQEFLRMRIVTVVTQESLRIVSVK